jgi:hypothetical protein
MGRWAERGDASCSLSWCGLLVLGSPSVSCNVSADPHELPALNDLNFDRFDAKVGERLAVLRSEMDQGLDNLRVELAYSIRDTKTSLLWWMFGLWTGNILASAGLLLAILKALKP